MLQKWVVFTGLSGSGKSFYAKSLAKKLNTNYFDLDKEIEQENKQSIAEIFAQKGELFFRKEEERVFFNIIKNNKKPSIISLGGGSLTNEKIKNYTFGNCYLIYVYKKIHLIYKIVKNSKRPLLKANIKTTLNKMLSNRKASYELANLTINCNKRKSNSKQIKNIVNCLSINKIINR